METVFNVPKVRFSSVQLETITNLGHYGFPLAGTSNGVSSYPETCIYTDKQTKKPREVPRSKAALIERNTPMPRLHQAILDGRYREAEFLIASGTVDVNEQGPFGWTAMHLVAKCYARLELCGQSKLNSLNTIAHMLIGVGARVDIQDRFGLNALASSEGKGPQALRQATSQVIARKASESGDDRGPWRLYRMAG